MGGGDGFGGAQAALGGGGLFDFNPPAAAGQQHGGAFGGGFLLGSQQPGAHNLQLPLSSLSHFGTAAGDATASPLPSQSLLQLHQQQGAASGLSPEVQQALAQLGSPFAFAPSNLDDGAGLGFFNAYAAAGDQQQLEQAAGLGGAGAGGMLGGALDDPALLERLQRVSVSSWRAACGWLRFRVMGAVHAGWLR